MGLRKRGKPVTEFCVRRRPQAERGAAGPQGRTPSQICVHPERPTAGRSLLQRLYALAVSDWLCLSGAVAFSNGVRSSFHEFLLKGREREINTYLSRNRHF